MTANMFTRRNDAGSYHVHTTQYNIENLILVVILTLQSNLEKRANTAAWRHVAPLNRASDRSWKKSNFTGFLGRTNLQKNKPISWEFLG